MRLNNRPQDDRDYIYCDSNVRQSACHKEFRSPYLLQPAVFVFTCHMTTEQRQKEEEMSTSGNNRRHFVGTNQGLNVVCGHEHNIKTEGLIKVQFTDVVGNSNTQKVNCQLGCDVQGVCLDNVVSMCF